LERSRSPLDRDAFRAVHGLLVVAAVDARGGRVMRARFPSEAN
jgi:hypothetical protein